MTGRGPSRQELIRRRRRNGFVGRRSEQVAFQEALRQVPEEATQFFFHIHGPGGVGKSTLARQLENAAREAGAITAYVDESVADPIEVMESVSTQLAVQGASSKEFDKMLTAYRQRRHDADSDLAETERAADSPGPATPPPSPSSMVVSQLGLAGLGLLPGVGAFTGAVDASHVAAGADRLKAVLSARLRSHEDVRLVLSPLQVLTPAFLHGLADAARSRPWAVLIFDTYERTGPLLDTWLRDVLVSDRYGELPANVMLVLAGQSRLDPQCWGDWLDLVTDLPLEVFTEDEARYLMASKGVTDERVIELVLKLSKGLPVLVSMLAEARPTDPAAVGDPSGTAVERFLRWETDPARRAAALACALPLELDEDVCRAAVDDEETAGELFDWVRSLPFVRDHAGRCLYHDVVRNAMLRLQRNQSPERWREQHARLAGAYQQQRQEIEGRAGSDGVDWDDERWRAARVHETYHRLCADARAALPEALGELVSAYHHDLTTLRHWVDVVARAGEDTDATVVTEAGQLLRAALDEPDPPVAALTILLSHDTLRSPSRALAHALRGRQHRKAERYEQAIADYDRAIELGLEGDLAHHGRGLVHLAVHQYRDALADFTRAVEADPADPANLAQRAWTHELLKEDEEAVGDYDGVLALEPDDVFARTMRGAVRRKLGHHDEAIADFDQALAIDPNYVFALTSRGRAYQALDRYGEAIADFDQALVIDPNYVFALTSRGLAHQALDRYGEAIADFDQALAIDPNYVFALTSRGLAHQALDRYGEAIADFDQAFAIDPNDVYALTNRGRAHQALDQHDEAIADFDQAFAIDPNDVYALTNRGRAYQALDRYGEAIADFDQALVIDPNYVFALNSRGRAHQALDQHDEAIADFDQALTIEPDSAWLLSGRANTHRLEGRYAAALADLTRALEVSPDNEIALSLRGLVYRLTGQYDAALADLTRAVELSPDNGWAHYERAVALHALHDPACEQALVRTIEILEAERASSEAPSHVVPVLGNLFLAHCLMSHRDKADHYLTAFLDAQPPPGRLSELLIAMNTLVDMRPDMDEFLTPFRRLLAEALTDAAGRYAAAPPP
ncbi:tetratricopeptide repeat protein [Streptomyces sp. NBC_01768]|uniref:tetratricopeptide repeat protein n=1 Tax=Streptomyces sp. NBC_01768 TaxID=2975938 RepID=UPI002DDC55D4|nr:tetratricopeptide repeat protein [Streptomyces sp. NBC_01768]WSC34005.1 tetratricopeptide repeat protein [Streptomyces sp. NBC_01768]